MCWYWRSRLPLHASGIATSSQIGVVMDVPNVPTWINVVTFVVRGLLGSSRESPTEEVPMSDTSGGTEGVKGAVEETKGKLKEAAGALAGNDSMTREGRAQQDKGDAQQDVAEKEAAAERARAEADRHEARERHEQA